MALAPGASIMDNFSIRKAMRYKYGFESLTYGITRDKEWMDNHEWACDHQDFWKVIFPVQEGDSEEPLGEDCWELTPENIAKKHFQRAASVEEAVELLRHVSMGDDLGECGLELIRHMVLQRVNSLVQVQLQSAGVVNADGHAIAVSGVYADGKKKKSREDTRRTVTACVCLLHPDMWHEVLCGFS